MAADRGEARVRYDASSPGGNQIWPAKKMGVWDLLLQPIPFPGHTFEVLSMDYNMLANQSHAATSSDPRNAVQGLLEHIAAAGHDDVRMVSFWQYVDWLDAQDPALLAKLRTLQVGAAPSEGWPAFTRPA